MEYNQKMHYKENLPQDTLHLLKDKLVTMGIDIEEQWTPVSTVGTYSCRVTIAGSNIGTNGKGVTKEYALASAYGEFFERYQNKALSIKDYKPFEKFGYYFVKDEVYMTAEEIVKSQNSFVDLILSQLNINDDSDEVKAKKFDDYFNIRKVENGKYLMYPFYNATKEKTEYLPADLTRPYYGTNGMCAGNKFHEALVQGFSELFERHVQKKVINEKLTLPEIPEKYIAKYPQVYEMYKTMKGLDNYNFYVKDCSLGGIFPVVALIVIEKNSGTFGVHFGSHPDFGIALERCFTESCQGKDITTHAKSSKIDFMNRRVYTRSNMYNIFGINKGQYPYQFLLRKSEEEFVPFEDVSNKSNEELLDRILDQLKTLGYDVYIRDVSILGFPSYQLIVPKLAELTELTEMDVKIENTFRYIQKLMHAPSKINAENVSAILATIHFYHRFNEYNSMQKIYSRNDDFKYPFHEISGDIAYFLAMCYVLQGEYKKAAEYIGLILSSNRLEENDQIVLHATQKYFEGRSINLSHDETMKYLEDFYDDGVCQVLDNLYLNPGEVIRLQYTDDCDINPEANLYTVMDKLNEQEITANIDQNHIKMYITRKEELAV